MRCCRPKAAVPYDRFQDNQWLALGHHRRGARSAVRTSPGWLITIRLIHRPAKGKIMSLTNFNLGGRLMISVGLLVVAAGGHGPARQVLAQAPAEIKQPLPTPA